LPILNADGVAYIENGWNKDHKIQPERKNMNPSYNCASADKSDNGVDLNRNFGIDFGQVDTSVTDYLQDEWLEEKKPKNKAADPCSLNYPGPNAFSEPETVAFKNFLTSHKDELTFVINVHSNGNAFIYPFNGRQTNDIEERRPGILSVFT